jgi:hypothetical protein
VQAFGEEFIARFTRTLAAALGGYYQLIYVPEISENARNFSRRFASQRDGIPQAASGNGLG